MSDAVLLRAEGLCKRFAGVPALDGLHLAIAPGEFLALLGGSGSGKSTLLRVIAGFERPDAGRLLLDGADLLPLAPAARPVNMMFQSYALFPHLSAFDNVAYGLRRDGVRGAALRGRVASALELVGLAEFAKRRPHQLSGGQRQRVALARALVKRPRLLLLDEPLGALDAGLRERTGFELRRLQRESGATFVMVTHDQNEAMSLADRIGVMQAGRLVQLGAPAELYERPATRFVAGFLGGANILEGHAEHGAMRWPGGVLRPADAVPDGACALALRPERVRLVDAAGAPNTAAGTVTELAYRGDSVVLLVALAGGGRLRAVLSGDAAPPARGAVVALGWADAALVPLAG